MLENNAFGAVRERRFIEGASDLVWEVEVYEDLREGLGENIVKLLGQFQMENNSCIEEFTFAQQRLSTGERKCVSM
jgi:hypothetical protein